jgi:hypothetical protein
MIITSNTIIFPSGTGARDIRMPVLFDKQIVNAHVALGGYEAEYTNSDHHIKRLTVQLSCQVGARVDDGWEVNVFARLHLRDKNNDDPFRGSVTFVLFAEPKPRIAPPVEF